MEANKATCVLEDLPVYGTESAPPSDQRRRLKITGLVRKPVSLSHDEILALPRTRLVADFNCVEGWVVKQIEWEGVRVKTLIDLAEPMPNAHYVVFKAGGYSVSLSVDGAIREETILAYYYKGEPLSLEHGGPLRLVFPFQQCYESVKWITDIELTEKEQEQTGKKIALARLTAGKSVLQPSTC